MLYIVPGLFLRKYIKGSLFGFTFVLLMVQFCVNLL